MPPQPRPNLAGVPRHLVQRCNGPQVCFFVMWTIAPTLTGPRAASLRYGGAAQAYLLMTNHVHLSLTPARAVACPG